MHRAAGGKGFEALSVRGNIDTILSAKSVHLAPFLRGISWIEEQHKDNSDTPYKFTGKELDTLTGLYYYGARYYVSKKSRMAESRPDTGAVQMNKFCWDV